jgi:hypothetical protein
MCRRKSEASSSNVMEVPISTQDSVLVGYLDVHFGGIFTFNHWLKATANALELTSKRPLPLSSPMTPSGSSS